MKKFVNPEHTEDPKNRAFYQTQNADKISYINYFSKVWIIVS